MTTLTSLPSPLSSANPEHLERCILAARCKRSLKQFVLTFWGCIPGITSLIWNWHLDVFCVELEQLAADVFANRPRKHDLVFNVPFGTSKSSVISVLFPAWCWANKPDMRFLCGTHTDSLVMDLASRCKNVVESEKYQDLFPDVLIRADRSAKGDYQTTAGGERTSCTVGGKTPTGRHCHICIIDDPLDPQGARSEAELETAARFMTEVIPSRVVNKEVSPTILVMQRVHQRDPTKIMLDVGKQEGAIPVRQVCLPGELVAGAAPVSPPELRQCYTDGLLDSLRMSRRVLVSFAGRLGRYAYSAQVLQNPTPPGGGMFQLEWFSQRIRTAPYDCRRVRYWDRAATENAGCATAGVLLALDEDQKLYVEHVVRGQWEPNKRNDKIVATAHRDKDRYGPKHIPLIAVEAERGSTGLESFQGLARRLMGFRVIEDRPTGSKDARAEPWADQLAAKNVWLVEDNWDIAGFVEEHLLFRPDLSSKRLGPWKDQVDAVAGAMRCLVSRQPATGTFRILKLNPVPKGSVRFLVLTLEELAKTVVEEPALLIVFKEPARPHNDGESEAGEGVMWNDMHVRTDGSSRELDDCPERPSLSDSREVLDVNKGAGDLAPPLRMSYRPGASPLPTHGCRELLGSVSISFAGIDPAALQEVWDQTLQPWNKLPAELMMKPEHGKQLWRLITKHRDPRPQVFVFADDSGGDVALAACLAVVDVLRQSRATIQLGSDQDRVFKEVDVPPNKHVYAAVKSSRGMVV